MTKNPSYFVTAKFYMYGMHNVYESFETLIVCLQWQIKKKEEITFLHVRIMNSCYPLPPFEGLVGRLHQIDMHCKYTVGKGYNCEKNNTTEGIRKSIARRQESLMAAIHVFWHANFSGSIAWLSFSLSKITRIANFCRGSHIRINAITEVCWWE